MEEKTPATPFETTNKKKAWFTNYINIFFFLHLTFFNRYRQRKRAELDSLEEQLHGLEGRNRELRDKAESVEREIQYVKDLLIEVYKARSQRLKQEASAWAELGSLTIDDCPASRIDSALNMDWNLSWNDFWSNVFFFFFPLLFLDRGWRVYSCTLC